MDVEIQLMGSHRWMAVWRGLNDEPFLASPSGSSSGVLILPIDAEQNIVFMREPRVHDGEWILTIPAGGIEDGEDVITAGNRELQEEIGFKGNKMELLGEYYPLARHGQLTLYGVLATDLVASKLPNPDVYDLVPTITRIPFAEFRDVIKRGDLHDSTIISMLYQAEDKLNKR